MSEPRKPRRRLSLWEILVILGLLVVVGALLLPPMEESRRETRTAMCRNNLERIGLALKNYHDQYGCFPPPVVTDEQGRPLHSRRVLLLPYLDQADLYGQYRMDEPWDGPNNKRLHQVAVDVFTCPDDDAARSEHHTSYVAVTGPGTCWDTTSPADGAPAPAPDAPTMAIIEARGTGIHWMSPRDVSLEQLTGVSWPPLGQPASHIHRKNYLFHAGPFTHALLADGSVLKIESKASAAQMRPLCTRGATANTSSAIPECCEPYR